MHDGRVVLVTGGAVGIGAGICQAFAESGASVSVADIDGDAANQFADKLKNDGHRAVAVTGDVSVLHDAERMVNESIESLGALDVLVNNAGIQPTASYMNAEQMDEETWDRIIGVNLKGQFLMAKFSIPHIRARGGGTIINIMQSVEQLADPFLIGWGVPRGMDAWSSSQGVHAQP